MLPRILRLALVTVTLFGLSSAAVAQTSAKDVGQQAAETAETIKNYTVEKKDEAVAHSKKVIADADRGIKELEKQAAKQTGEAKAKSQALVKDLKAKRAAASKKASELGRATKASWDKAKDGFASAYRDMAASFEQAAAQFKN